MPSPEDNDHQRRIELTAERLPAFFEHINRLLALEKEGAKRASQFGQIGLSLRSQWVKPIFIEEPQPVKIASIDDQRLEEDEARGFQLFETTESGWICAYHVVYVYRLFGDMPKIICQAYRIRDISEHGHPKPYVFEVNEGLPLVKNAQLDQIVTSLGELAHDKIRPASDQ